MGKMKDILKVRKNSLQSETGEVHSIPEKLGGLPKD